MVLVEIACFFIVTYFVTLRLARATVRRPVIQRLLLLAGASFLGEDSVIRAYHFYGYSRSWHLFVDRVPLSPAEVAATFRVSPAALRGRFGELRARLALTPGDARFATKP